MMKRLIFFTHFLEHMAFNGTQCFFGKGILNTLQKHGGVFEKDIIEYASFDETIYNLIDILTKEGLVDRCLIVLNDLSNDLLQTNDKIEVMAYTSNVEEYHAWLKEGISKINKYND